MDNKTIENKDKRYAEYTHRPLTAEEKQFAEDPEHFNILYRYMRYNRLDEDEWYDILIIPFLQAVKKYLSIPKLQRFDFGAVLFKTLDSARWNHFKALNRLKRKPTGGLVSLNYPVNENSTAEEYMESCYMDVKTNVEHQIVLKENFQEFQQVIDNLYRHDEMKPVLRMLIFGYSEREIVAKMRENKDFPDWTRDDYGYVVEKLRSAFRMVYGV